MKQTTTLEEIKIDYGETVFNSAVINLMQIGKKSLNNVPLKEQLNNLNNVFDNLEKEKKPFPVTKEFALQILNCEYQLNEFDDMQILTFFSKTNVKKEN